MTLKDMIQADSLNVFINADEFAESVVYIKRPGITRVINAVVFRQSVSTSDEAGGISVPFFEVHVANSDTLGIAATEIDLGGDVLRIAVRPGMTATDRAIMSIVEQDEGMLVLQCQ